MFFPRFAVVVVVAEGIAVLLGLTLILELDPETRFEEPARGIVRDISFAARVKEDREEACSGA